MQTNAPINSADLSGMVEHWVGCPPNGYLGQSYGSDIKALLQTPMASGLADDLVEKCRADVPLAAQAGAGAINVYSYDRDFETKAVVFEVAGELIQIGGN